MTNLQFPTEKGTYILLLELEPAAKLRIGKLGEFDFPAGWYAYVGSAFGGGGLRGRLKHHCSPVKKPHWHIDYLRQAATVREVWYSASDIRQEHEWANLLISQPGASVPAPRFGASDCSCAAHLIHFHKKPDLSAAIGEGIQGFTRGVD